MCTAARPHERGSKWSACRRFWRSNCAADYNYEYHIIVTVYHNPILKWTGWHIPGGSPELSAIHWGIGVLFRRRPHFRPR